MAEVFVEPLVPDGSDIERAWRELRDFMGRPRKEGIVPLLSAVVRFVINIDRHPDKFGFSACSTRVPFPRGMGGIDRVRDNSTRW